MGPVSGLVHKKHRRGKKRRDRLRLALRAAIYVVVLGFGVGLSAGIIHVVERPILPFKAMASEASGPDTHAKPGSEEPAGFEASSVPEAGTAVR